MMRRDKGIREAQLEEGWSRDLTISLEADNIVGMQHNHEKFEHFQHIGAKTRA